MQDGLTLAALCQVHLLNNLHKNQRPDLLFLNSYLIAIITGYITVDLGFAGAFLAYVPFYILGLQFLAIFRPDARLSGAEVRAIALDGAKRSAVLLGLALLAFVFWPRDFEREALLSRYFEFSPSDAQAKVDFSESLKLGQRGGGDADLGRVVMTIRPAGPDAQEIPSLWRGTTLAQHLRDGSWERHKGPVAKSVTGDATWEGGPIRNSAMRGAVEGARTGRVRVTRAGGGTQVLFMPYGTVAAALAPIHTQGVLQSERDGTLRYSNPGELRYELTLGAAAQAGSPDEAAFVRLSPSIHTRTAADLAGLLRGRLGETHTPMELAQEFTDYLRGRYPYRLPAQGSDDDSPPAATLHEFLTSEKGGHCEFFASALATMLRSEEIPARVVTGFRVGDFDPEARTWTVRSTSAHAWVEAHLDGAWRTFDPTPAADREVHGQGWLDRVKNGLSAVWSRVTSFDAEARAQLTAWVQGLPSRFISMTASNPIASVLSALLLALGIVFRRQRRLLKTPASIRQLRAAMKAADVPASGGQTPREILANVERQNAVDPETVKSLRRAVIEHERERFTS